MLIFAHLAARVNSNVAEDRLLPWLCHIIISNEKF